MYNIFEADNTDAVLLIDASNAFNSLNRAAALYNVRILCPTIATYAINTYREPARLIIIGGKSPCKAIKRSPAWTACQYKNWFLITSTGNTFR